MGAIASPIQSILGGGATNGGSWTAQAAPLTNPLAPGQLQASYEQQQAALTGQQNLAQQLSGQAQMGMGQQANVYGQQQDLANALRMQSMGQGPNPAQAALNQATGQNIAAQSAMMGGQRGANQNVGLMSRQIANQGAHTQQQAVGQGAIMQAQQQMAAQQQLAAQQQAMQQVSQQQIGNQMGSQQAFTNAALGAQGQAIGGTNAFNQAAVGSIGSMNSANANMAAANAHNQAGLLGGLMNGIGQAGMMGAFSGGSGASGSSMAANGLADLGGIFGAEGGLGSMASFGGGAGLAGAGEGFGAAGGSLAAAGTGAATGAAIAAYKGGKIDSHLQQVHQLYHGGQVNALVSPGEKYLSPKEAKNVASGKESIKNAGKTFKGKAMVKGDSKKNDNIPTKLEEGGIVIPRSVMQSADPIKEGTKFLVEALKKHGKSGEEQSDFKKALQSAIKSRSK